MALVEPLKVMFLQDGSLASTAPASARRGRPDPERKRFIGPCLSGRAYLFVPVLQPLPTTKSPAPENETEYPLLAGEKLTDPLVT